MIIKYWQGTDVLRLKVYHPTSKPFRTCIRIALHRFFWRHFHRFFRHWVHSERFIPTLSGYGISVAHTQPMPPAAIKVTPIPHDRMTIMCYLPETYDSRYQRWVYGADFVELAQKALPNCRFIKIDGSQNMWDVLPLVDVYLKFNRWEGQWTNRLAMECEANGIRVFRTNYVKSDLENLKDLIKWLDLENF